MLYLCVTYAAVVHIRRPATACPMQPLHATPMHLLCCSILQYAVHMRYLCSSTYQDTRYCIPYATPACNNYACSMLAYPRICCIYALLMQQYISGDQLLHALCNPCMQRLCIAYAFLFCVMLCICVTYASAMHVLCSCYATP